MVSVLRSVAVLGAAIVMGSIAADAAQSPYYPIAVIHSSDVHLDSRLSQTPVTTLNIPRTNIPIGTLEPIGRQPLYVVRLSADGRPQNFSTARFPRAGRVPWVIRNLQSSGEGLWVTFYTGMVQTGSAARIARGRNGSLWIRLIGGRFPGDDGPLLGHITRNGHLTFFAKPTFLGNQYTMASNASGDLWIFDPAKERVIRLDESGRAFLNMQFEIPSNERDRLGFDIRFQPNGAFWLTDGHDRLVYVPLDDSPAKQLRLQRPVRGKFTPWWSIISDGYSDEFFRRRGIPKGVGLPAVPT